MGKIHSGLGPFLSQRAYPRDGFLLLWKNTHFETDFSLLIETIGSKVVCVRGEGVQGVLTLICSGVAQTCHDDRVVELKEQLVVEKVDREGQEGKVKEEGRGRVRENAP